MSTEFEIKVNNRDKIVSEFNKVAIVAMEACGLAGEAYAVKNIDAKGIVDTGNLKASITHDVEDAGNEVTAYIGTNVEYGIYNELGTGEFYPGGRKTPWVYQDAKGKWHRTTGMIARPFLKPAITDNVDKYKEIIKNRFKG